MVENWFFTPLYYSFVSDQTGIQSDFLKVLDTIERDNGFQQVPDWKSHLISDTTFSKNLLDDFGIETFKQELDIHIRSYLRDIRSPVIVDDMTYTIKSCWMTKNVKHSYAHNHSHGDVDLSGVYYVKTTGDDGNIMFENPNKLLAASYCFQHLVNRITYKPEVGKILLFPGWLEHSVITNTTDSERISVSFNIVFDRKV
jgi:uncharacterized protein (TIGR02466 family)